MEAAFKIWETNRNIYAKFLEKYTLEQLNTIPTGFSNNLVWNLGHIIVSQQGLVYRLSGLPMNITPAMMETYRNGSKPTGTTTQEEVDELKTLLFSLLEKTKEDYAAGKFVAYN
ncbi:MAG: DinB family protein, partial [Bacteroidota bacterium]